MDRFWNKVDFGLCWNWMAARDRHGYGRFCLNSRTRSKGAHQVAWELLVGPVPDGFQLDHLCRNTSCVNPDHLEVVTFAENVRRGIALKGQSWKTHCKNGHEFTPENTYSPPGPRPKRQCRACNRAAVARYQRSLT